MEKTDLELSVGDVKKLLAKPDTTLLDARPSQSWEQSGCKLPGALRFDPERARAFAHNHERDRRLVFYGDGRDDGFLINLATLFRHWGYSRAHVMSGGLERWSSLSNPLENKRR